jgi:hypothetical protein
METVVRSMNILKHGYKETGTITFDCINCGCMFEANKGEYEHYHSSMSVNQSGDIFVSTCPECKTKLHKYGCLGRVEIAPVD